MAKTIMICILSKPGGNMIYQLYAILDSKSEVYDLPMYFRTDAEACRAFGTAVHDQEHRFGKHPEDYSMWRVGSFDQTTGRLTPRDPVNVSMGIDQVFEARNANGQDTIAP